MDHFVGLLGALSGNIDSDYYGRYWHAVCTPANGQRSGPRLFSAMLTKRSVLALAARTLCGGNDLRLGIGPTNLKWNDHRGPNMANKDQIAGAAKDVGGKIQEEAGKLVGSKEQELKGLQNQAGGKMQQAVGDIKAMVSNLKAEKNA